MTNISYLIYFRGKIASDSWVDTILSEILEKIFGANQSEFLWLKMAKDKQDFYLK